MSVMFEVHDEERLEFLESLADTLAGNGDISIFDTLFTMELHPIDFDTELLRFEWYDIDDLFDDSFDYPVCEGCFYDSLDDDLDA